jgi:hypothetical protein
MLQKFSCNSFPDQTTVPNFLGMFMQPNHLGTYH